MKKKMNVSFVLARLGAVAGFYLATPSPRPLRKPASHTEARLLVVTVFSAGWEKDDIVQGAPETRKAVPLQVRKEFTDTVLTVQYSTRITRHGKVRRYVLVFFLLALSDVRRDKFKGHVSNVWKMQHSTV